MYNCISCPGGLPQCMLGYRPPGCGPGDPPRVWAWSPPPWPDPSTSPLGVGLESRVKTYPSQTSFAGGNNYNKPFLISTGRIFIVKAQRCNDKFLRIFMMITDDSSMILQFALLTSRYLGRVFTKVSFNITM